MHEELFRKMRRELDAALREQERAGWSPLPCYGFRLPETDGQLYARAFERAGGEGECPPLLDPLRRELERVVAQRRSLPRLKRVLEAMTLRGDVPSAHPPQPLWDEDRVWTAASHLTRRLPGSEQGAARALASLAYAGWGAPRAQVPRSERAK